MITEVKERSPDDLLDLGELAELSGKTIHSLRYHLNNGRPKRDPKTNALISQARGLYLISQLGGDGRIRIPLGKFHEWLSGRPLADVEGGSSADAGANVGVGGDK